jgi:hypothetical protein
MSWKASRVLSTALRALRHVFDEWVRAGPLARRLRAEAIQTLQPNASVARTRSLIDLRIGLQ